MGLFQKKIGTVFLKEESDAEEFIKKMKELFEKASGELKDEIEKQIKIANYGLQGEKSIAFELRNSGLDMYVLHDIYLEVGEMSAQIDYLLVTRKHIYVLECKNLIGNIEVDNEGNFIRSYELAGRKIREGIYSPITQNQRHLQVIKEIGMQRRKNVLSKMLFEKSFEESYKSLIVLANPKTCLNAKYAKKEVKTQIVRVDQLINRLKEMDCASREASLSDEAMRQIAESFLNVSKKNHSDYAKKYEELMEELKNDSIHEETPDLKTDSISNGKEGLVTEKENADERENKKQVLKKFRLEYSRAEGIKPYFIFNDAQMEDLLEKNPKTKEELLQVSGFGKVKSEKYGEMILQILKNEKA